uniref:Uncharacterized protein n=1 Tax=Trypanosoma congolense (strain IL3000) TaxID=1068625 RepID=G0UJ64_TRYCI|nr:conserved hypothetical protein [Trypanosoma congolense IL3000]
MSLLQRQTHSAGLTRVSIDGQYFLSGGADGVVALHPLRRFPVDQPLWARQCHTGPVTCVRLNTSLRLAISCGRDGAVVLHEDIINSTASSGDGSGSSGQGTARVVCRVTGELRTVLFDAERWRVFIAGDSLRCLQIRKGGCDVCTIPMSVPHPIVSLALSPCGSLLAVASASCAIGVVSACSLSSEACVSPLDEKENTSDKKEERAKRLKDLRIAVANMLTPTAKREDSVAYRLAWCTSGNNDLCLLVPGVTEARVLRFEEAMTPPYNHRLRHIGTVDSLGLTDLIGVTCYPLTTHVMCVLLVGVSGTAVGKVDTRKWSIIRVRSQEFNDVGDAEVDCKTGDVVVGTIDGCLTYLRREAPKVMGISAKEDAEGEVKTKGNGEEVSSRKRVRNESPTQGAEKHTTENNHRRKAGGRSFVAKKDCAGGSDDGFIVDDEDDTESDSGRTSASSRSSATVVNEDLQQVVVDLKRTNPSYDDAISEKERSSRWRNEDPRGVLRSVEKLEPPRRSIFLDDEAVESSDDGSTGSASDERDGCAERSPCGKVHRRHGGKSHANEEECMYESGAGRSGSSVDVSQVLNDAAIPSAAVPAGALVKDYFFQIGATLPGEEESCYLAYNSVGYILCTAEGATVHFHDMSLQAVRILERGAILMASLSPVGAAFVIAQEPTDPESVDDLTPRLTIYYRTFVAIGLQSDWRLRLHEGEVVRCVATGVRYTAVATSRYLRIFSLSGLELAVLSLFPRIVAMVGTNSSKIMRGYREDFDPLAVCYLETGGDLRLQVLDVGSRNVVVPPTTVPVTLTHQLQWMGWSEDGPLHIADTAGVVQMFTNNWGGSWLPVYDPRCLTDQTYNLWIWGVCDESVLAYRSCKSDPPYPAAVAGGLPTERISLFVPLLRAGTERDMITWDHLLRREVRADEIKRRSDFYTGAIAKHDMLHDKKIMELFTKALNEQEITRAIDLATYLELRDNIELCAKEANAKGNALLVQKLLALLEVRVRSKKRRRCPLPLEGSVVSERERDMLLRKMLLKEKAESSKSSNVDNNNGIVGEVSQGTTNTIDNKRDDSVKVGRNDTADVLGGSEVGLQKDGRGPTPIGGSASSATGTTVTDPISSRRRVTFMESSVPSSPPRQPTEASALNGGNSHGSIPLPQKPTNSFTRRSINNRGSALTTVVPAALLEREPIPQHQLLQKPKKPMNPFSKEAKTTVTTLTDTKDSLRQPPAAAVTPSTMLVLGDSQEPGTFGPEGGSGIERNVGEPQQRLSSDSVAAMWKLSSSPSTAAATTGTPRPGEELNVRSQIYAGTEGNDADMIGSYLQDELSPMDATRGNMSKDGSVQTSVLASPLTSATITADHGSVARTHNFVHRESTVASVVSGTPLTQQAEESVNHFCDLSEEGPVSIESLVVDVGHESSLPFTPRSASFGAALRKRYREEDEEDSCQNDINIDINTGVIGADADAARAK